MLNDCVKITVELNHMCVSGGFETFLSLGDLWHESRGKGLS